MTSSLPEHLPASCEVPQDVRREIARVGPRLNGVAKCIHWLDTTGSTNTIAARLAELGAEDGTVVVAEAQTAGRGRIGRVWHSPAGAGLYASVVLKPAGARFSPHDNPTALLTLAAGVAVAEGVQAATGLAAEIKWPNDLIVARRKLAGILAEAAAQSGAVQFIVLGVGVNLRPASYPPELNDRVTSIEAETNQPADRALILAEILAALASRCADLHHGRFDAILTAWRARASSLRGAVVEWNMAGSVARGRAEGIDDSGALLVRAGGDLQRIVAGEVKWL